MRKILLLNPPGRRRYIRDYYCSLVSKLNYYWPPLDLVMLSGWLYGYYKLKVMDAIVENINHKQAYKKIMKMDIDTIIFITGAVSWKEDFEFLEKIANNRKIDFIGSGDILLYHGRELMKKYGFLNAISLDFTTPDILTYLRKADGRKIDNFIYRKDGLII